MIVPNLKLDKTKVVWLFDGRGDVEIRTEESEEHSFSDKIARHHFGQIKLASKWDLGI